MCGQKVIYGLVLGASVIPEHQAINGPVETTGVLRKHRMLVQKTQNLSGFECRNPLDMRREQCIYKDHFFTCLWMSLDNVMTHRWIIGECIG